MKKNQLSKAIGSVEEIIDSWNAGVTIPDAYLEEILNEALIQLKKFERWKQTGYDPR